MRYRHWFLVVAAVIFTLTFLMLNVPYLNQNLIHYGEGEIQSRTGAAIACLLSWLVLEVTHHVLAARPPRCRCGYSLAGVRCPECGQQLGDPDVRTPAEPDTGGPRE